MDNRELCNKLYPVSSFFNLLVHFMLLLTTDFLGQMVNDPWATPNKSLHKLMLTSDGLESRVAG